MPAEIDAANHTTSTAHHDTTDQRWTARHACQVNSAARTAPTCGLISNNGNAAGNGSTNPTSNSQSTLPHNNVNTISGTQHSTANQRRRVDNAINRIVLIAKTR